MKSGASINEPKMEINTLIHAVEHLIERHLRGDLIGPEEYGRIQDAVILNFQINAILRKYMTDDRYFLFGTFYQRYGNPSELLAEIQDQLDCKL